MIDLRRRSAGALAFALVLATAASGKPAEQGSVAIRDSFRIGTEGVPCTAQLRGVDADAPGMFDRAYAIVCRDAAAEVGRLFAVRAGTGDPIATLLARRAGAYDCARAVPAAVAGASDVTRSDCTRRDDSLPYRLYAVRRGNTAYVAEGLRGYDSAVVLGLRTILSDRPVAGAVEIAVTEAGDPAAFARTQAGALDTQSALSEGYLRNNAGSFAEAAAFFGALVDGSAQRPRDVDSAEYFLNDGLQQANLGNAPAAAMAFQQAEERGAPADPVLGRLLRNYRAMTLLNQRDARAAIAMLATPVLPISAASDAEVAGGTITDTLAERFNRGNAGNRRLGGADGKLRPYERAQILDGQAALLRGTALRLRGRNRDALGAFGDATALIVGVRGGKVVSAGFLRSEILAESALASEALSNFGAADRDMAASLHLLELNYPRSAAGLMAKARLAAYRARRGDTAGALGLYGEVVASSGDVPGGAAPLRDLLKPYFLLLAKRGPDDAQAAEQMFAANQVLVRPGLAQTQAVLARELSAGDDAAARLFRESLNRSRDVTRATGEVTQLADTAPREGSVQAVALADARARLAALQKEQVALQARLADYPRYRVLDTQGLTLADLQRSLKPGEAYYELRLLGQDAYAVLVTPGAARAAKIAATSDQLAASVSELRASIVRIDQGRFVTEPFKLALARKLYVSLFGPFGDALNGVDHLIYEADGPLLQLPANLLVTDQASVDRYAARAAKPGANLFDFTGVAWLGRGRDVSTAVSPRAFIDVRGAAASRARLAYIGLGHNAPPNLMAGFLSVRPTPAVLDRCAWPVTAWQNPISADELEAASALLGARQSAVVTGAAFNDVAIGERKDLANYRIVHFATHGLVTAARPECPARPALLTSFGPGASDGLLSFREIYDLRIDADIVILSACDTAGMATIEATRDAGVSTGGNFALDGLVRAFVGAGARTVIASHWPVPDDYNATRQLILGMVGAPPGTPVATALRRAETALMDAPDTSHPYYWAAFAVVGDGERPIVAPR